MRPRWRHSPVWWAAALALLLAGPAVLAALGVTWPVAVAGSAVAAALGAVLSAVVPQWYLRRVEQRDAQQLAFRDGCLCGPDGRAPRVRDVADLTLLGVHPAIGGAAERVPTYVPRQVDDRFRERLRAGGLVVLLGDSAAGKSRSAAEAVRATVPDHILICPFDRAAIPAALAAARDHGRWVLWLDDLERFLGPDGLTRARLLPLLSPAGPDHVVVATLRAAEYSRYTETAAESGADRTGRDHSRDARDLLEQADFVPVDRLLTAAEQARAAAVEGGDHRIADAVEHAGRYGLAEYLVAGPECLTVWRNAWAAGVHPRGAALVAAAVDTRRAGIVGGMSRGLLDRLHEQYLQRRGGAALRPESLHDAWEWATRTRRGTTGLLVPSASAEDHVDVFDYLVDSVQRTATAEDRIPADVLTALLDVADTTELTTIGQTAFGAGHFAVALQAYRTAFDRRNSSVGADHPDTIASRRDVALMLNFLGRTAEAGPVWRELVAASTRTYGPGHATVLDNRLGLANALEPAAAEPRLRELCEEYSQTLGPDHRSTVDCREDLASTLHRLGRHTEAQAERERLLGLLAPADDSGLGAGARHRLAYLLTSVGRLDEAERQWHRAVDAYVADLGADHPLTLRARHGIAWVETSRGLRSAARRRLEPLADDFLRELGPDHPWTRDCLGALAQVTD